MVQCWCVILTPGTFVRDNGNSVQGRLLERRALEEFHASLVLVSEDLGLVTANKDMQRPLKHIRVHTVEVWCTR